MWTQASTSSRAGAAPVRWPLQQLTSLMAGKIKLHVYMTPPSPAQEIDFVLEYDASYVTSALQG